MQHEQGLADSLLAIEVNPVASLDVLIINDEVRGFLDVSDECFKLLLSFF